MKRALVLLSGLLVLLGGLSGATAYVAGQLHYAEALGSPWCTIGETRLYPPWAWLEWERLYAGRPAVVFRNASGIATLTAIAAAVL